MVSSNWEVWSPLSSNLVGKMPLYASGQMNQVRFGWKDSNSFLPTLPKKVLGLESETLNDMWRGASHTHGSRCYPHIRVVDDMNNFVS